jgi:AraC-like DNA-binding protein
MCYFVRELQQCIRIKQKFMIDIYIKDSFGKVILSEKVQEDSGLRYEKTVVVTKERSLTVTIALNHLSPATHPQWTEKDLSSFNRITELINSDLSKNFSIEELAEHAAMNRTKLQAGFKQVFHKTINSFTQELKMQKAKDLISGNRGFSLKEIAGMLGYRHSNHFSVAFKKWFNVSPSAFKNTIPGIIAFLLFDSIFCV